MAHGGCGRGRRRRRGRRGRPSGRARRRRRGGGELGGDELGTRCWGAHGGAEARAARGSDAGQHGREQRDERAGGAGEGNGERRLPDALPSLAPGLGSAAGNSLSLSALVVSGDKRVTDGTDYRLATANEEGKARENCCEGRRKRGPRSEPAEHVEGDYLPQQQHSSFCCSYAVDESVAVSRCEVQPRGERGAGQASVPGAARPLVTGKRTAKIKCPTPPPAKMARRTPPLKYMPRSMRRNATEYWTK